ncbi:DNA cytosine methyltransferase [Brachybacterium tyrofermentans]|uniref:DNA cytosine methyltransferase n=1 Tax=Brachybacterium tyrofermentans TaxID=47848 RepID=UPI003FD44F59
MTSSLTSSPDTSVRGEAITIIDLFAGVGGLSEGFHRASDRYKVLKAVEMEPRAAAGYRLNHNADVYCGPIQEWLREEDVPSADLVIGGPPCQGFSTLGKQRADDVRNELWRAYAEVVQRARPRYFVLENVPQFLTSPQFPLFQRMTEPGGELEDYETEHHVLNAADYGAPQVRKRVIVIGHRRDQADPGFPKKSHPEPADWMDVESAIGALPNALAKLPEDVFTDVNGKRTPGPFLAKELHVRRNYSQLSLDRFAAIPEGGNRMDLPEKLKCEAWKKHTSGSADVMGRLRWDKPSVTIRTEFIKPEKGRYLHPTADRAITAWEGARLQGFPAGYKFVGPMTEIVKQIGNAVPIPLGKAIGTHLEPFFG